MRLSWEVEEDAALEPLQQCRVPVLPKVGAVHEHDAPLGELLRLEAVGPLTEVGNELPAGQGLREDEEADFLPHCRQGYEESSASESDLFEIPGGGGFVWQCL